MSTADSEQYNLLDQLAEEFAARFRRGERPALKEYTDRYPALAQEIRELFPALVRVEQVEGVHQGEGASEVTGDSRADGPPVRQFGDYRIVREIGRGGMGIVYEAEQISPDGKIMASSSADATTILWGPASWTPLRTLEGHSEGINKGRPTVLSTPASW
jgi:hypothetical protein